MLPAIFFGHGNPMNAISENAYTEAWSAIGRALPRPTAIVSVSAHWYVAGTGVTLSTSPKTIHDFGGFPEELYQVQYPAPGDADLARRIQKLLSPVPVSLDEKWGLDHGTWSVLRHVYPEADIPVIQLSIDLRKSPEFHYEIGQRLAALREENILIAGSGNVVHNLRAYAWGREGAEPHAWAERFQQTACELMLANEDRKLVDYAGLGRDAALSIPTPDHYLPLLYVLATRTAADPIAFPVEGVEGGSVSMLAVQVGS